MVEILYDTDFYVWTQAQVEALRAKDWTALDLEHLAEEIESLGASERRAVRSHLRILLMHRLKWISQPDKRSESCLSSMYTARVFIEETMEDSPSLQRFLPEALAWGYLRARQDAANDTGLPLTTFPETCPWSLDQLQAPSFLTEA